MPEGDTVEMALGAIVGVLLFVLAYGAILGYVDVTPLGIVVLALVVVVVAAAFELAATRASEPPTR